MYFTYFYMSFYVFIALLLLLYFILLSTFVVSEHTYTGWAKKRTIFKVYNSCI